MAEVRLPSQVKTGPSVLPLFFPSPGFRTNNYYDQCLAQDKAEYDAAFNCGELPKLGGTEHPWITMPMNGRRFAERGTFSAANAIVDGTTVSPVLSFLIPVGYDGVITTIICSVQGSNTGFIEGSGSIAFRLSADGRYLRDNGNILFSLGSLLQPIPDVNNGLRVFSQNLVQFGVTFTNLGNINPTALIVCACYGWIYPR